MRGAALHPLAFALAFAFAFGAAGAAAQSADASIERQATELAAQLRCPVCQGLSIQDSPTELAQAMKDVIRDQLRAGSTPDEVKAYFVAKYGEWILLRPEPEGFNLAVYVLPLVLLLGGVVVIAVSVRRWTAAPRATDA